jgi:Uma2 family endonuclease
MSGAAILDIPEVRDRVQRWSVQDYERLVEEGIFGKNSELIRGFAIKKMSKSPLHISFSLRLYDRIKVILPSGYTARHEGPLRFADSLPEPDVAIVRGEAEDFLQQHPTTAVLVIEVAVSSAALDRENAGLYAEAGVQEYWIVLPRERRIEVYRQPSGGTYAEHVIVEGDAVVLCSHVPGVQFALQELFG